MDNESFGLSALLLSLAALIISILSALYTRRQAVIMEKQYEAELNRKALQIELTDVVRSDSDSLNDESYNDVVYPECFVLKFTISNPSDEPRLLKNIKLCWVFRDINRKSYFWSRYAEWELNLRKAGFHLDTLCDQFPYNGSYGFAAKSLVCLLDAGKGEVIDLTKPLKINARDKVWIEVLIRITSEWRKILRDKRKALRYLMIELILADQKHETRVNINNSFLGHTHYGGLNEEEAEKFDRFM